MRLRHIKNSHEVIAKHPLMLVNPELLDGKIAKLFVNENPLHVEFGSGYGGYLFELSRRNKDINYLAFEWNIKVVIRGLKKMEIEGADNFRYVHADVGNIDQILESNSVDRIYLNFSDPWPKDRHAKRRLTSHDFLTNYEKLLKQDGEIHFKTDNNDLFEYSVEELEKNNWTIKMITRDLHNSEYAIGNIMTEYEKKFSEEGKNINKLIAIKLN